MEYKATFRIDGDYMPETREISANNYQDAHQQAMDLAGNIAKDYSNNPTVQLSSLERIEDDHYLDVSNLAIRHDGKSTVIQALKAHMARLRRIASLEDKMREKSSE